MQAAEAGKIRNFRPISQKRCKIRAHFYYGRLTKVAYDLSNGIIVNYYLAETTLNPPIL